MDRIGSAHASLAWSIDFVGRQKAAIERARAGAVSATLESDAVRLALIGAVYETYINLVRADAHVATDVEMSRLRELGLRLAEGRYGAGLGTKLEVENAKAQLEEARQARLASEHDRLRMVHALAVLAGQGADYYATVGRTQLDLATVVAAPTELPVDLLSRRPDIQAAQARVVGAYADRQVVRARFFPNVSLNALIGISAVGLTSIFSGAGLDSSVGPAIHLPIFEGGRLAAHYRAATAQIDVAAADYNLHIIEAIREASDALTSVTAGVELGARQSVMVSSLAAAERIQNARFGTGLGARSSLVDASARLLAAKRVKVDIDAETAVQRVRLVLALGGGVRMDSPSRQISSDKLPSQGQVR